MVAPPTAVGTSTVGQHPVVHLPATVRADRRWVGRTLPHGWRYSLLRRMLVCADIVAAFLASLMLGFVSGGAVDQFAWSVGFLPVWLGIAKLLGLYDRDERPLRHTTIDEALYLLLWAVLGTSVVALLLLLTPAGWPDASTAVAAGLVAAVAVFSLRALARFLWRTVTPPERVAIIGSPVTTSAVNRKLELFRDLHMTVVDEHDVLEVDERRASELLGAVDRLIYAPASLDTERVQEILDLSRSASGLLTVVLPYRHAFGPAAQLNHLAELPVLEYKRHEASSFTTFLKRAIDVAGSAIALVALWPLFIVLAIAIKLDSPGPVFFAQVRAGIDGRPFRMLKFRSMVVDAEELLENLVSFDHLAEPMFKLQDDPRVTRFGRFLRRWSLDELPQLWNVLQGDMSLVGPRPEDLELVERYEPEHRDRLGVKPGITGPMQVLGRGELTFSERLAVERDYIENISIAHDLRILAMTIPAALSGRGAY
jgi:exopolysaccharide biosynthesis polyprenyl glycosylphosphotransferase